MSEEVEQYEVKNELDLWPTFRVKVHKGLVIWCSDNSHPVGASWAALSNYYNQRSGELACTIRKVKEDE